MKRAIKLVQELGFRRALNFRSVAGFAYIPIAAISGLLSSSAVISQLSHEDSGLFFLCQGILPFVLLLDMGLLTIGTREIAFALGRQRGLSVSEGQHNEVLYTFLSFRDARLLTMALIIVLGLVALIAFFTIGVNSANANFKATLLCVVSSLLVLMSYSYQAHLEGTGHYYIDRISSAITVLIMGLLIAGAAYIFHSIVAVILAWYIGQATTLIGKAFASHRLQPEVHGRSRMDLERVRDTFSQSFSLFVLQVGATLTKASQFPIITLFLGVAKLSNYFFVVRIAATIDQAISVFNASQRANFSKLCGAGNSLEAYKLMRTVFAQILVCAVVAALGIIFIMPRILTWLSGPARISEIPFTVIGVDLVGMTLSGMMSQFVIASGTNPFAKVVIVTGLLTLALLFVLIPAYGLAGAALGQMLANSCTNLGYSAWHFWRLAARLRREGEEAVLV